MCLHVRLNVIKEIQKTGMQEGRLRCEESRCGRQQARSPAVSGQRQRYDGVPPSPFGFPVFFHALSGFLTLWGSKKNNLALIT